MPKFLTTQQVHAFEQDGYVSPVRIMSSSLAAQYRERLEQFERAQGSPLKGGQRNKGYLLFTWAHEILTNPTLLDAVEDLIGPDFVVYHSTTWIKEANAPGFVSWHQDSTYFGLEPLEEVTAWVALSAASSEAGCVRVLPGSHKLGQLPADLRPQKDNLLSSGQTVKLDVDESATVEMPLLPGEVSLHQACTIHGSGGNRSPDRRIGLCLHYVPSHVLPMKHLRETGALCSAMLVRGKAKHAFFPPEPAPRHENDPAAIAAHAQAVQSYRNMVHALGHNTASRFD